MLVVLQQCLKRPFDMTAVPIGRRGAQLFFCHCDYFRLRHSLQQDLGRLCWTTVRPSGEPLIFI